MARVINLLFLVIICMVMIFSFYTFRTSFKKFDIVQIKPQSITKNNHSDQLDQILYKNINAFAYIRSFDHLLNSNPYSYHFNSLWVDQCEVRQGDFYKFIKWQSNQPVTKIKSDQQPKKWSYKSTSIDHKISGQIQAPANGITYYDAYAYCKAAGGRLPTKSEWIVIASGKQQYLYPWGNQFIADAWPYLDSRLNAAQTCGKHPNNHSAKKDIYNLGDTVSEWASPDTKSGKPSIHGGNAYNKPFELYSLNYLYRYAPATYRSPYVGFRCVYDQQPVAIQWTKKTKTFQLPSNTHTLGFPETTKIPKLLINLSGDKIKVIKNIFNYKQHNNNFHILKHEVTRKQYQDFLNDLLVQLGIYAHPKEPKDHTYTPLNWENNLTQEEEKLPVTGIDWWSAWAFAHWTGGRLPSAIEWTAAASNFGSQVYPWGNQLKPYSASAENKYLLEKPIYSHPSDKTVSGIYDMGGNISEWTNSMTLLSNHYVAVIKGGNYSLPRKDTAKIDFDNHAPLSLKSPTIGFRIVFD